MGKNRLLEYLKSFIESVLLGLIIAVLVINFVFIAVTVQGTSMEPHLHENQKGVSFVIAKLFGIDRFDVVVLRNNKNEKLIVKRVIGLPGETIQYIDNELYVNGNRTVEPFLAEGTYTNNFSIILDEDEYFCLGDNRVVSRDSRYYGPFSKEQIVSKGVFVLYPFDQIGLVND